MYNVGTKISSTPCRKHPTREGMKWVKEYVESQIAKRALQVVTSIVAYMEAVGIKRFTIAGGALLRGPINDIDIWPSPWDLAPYQKLLEGNLNGRNYYEETINGQKVQFCQAPVCPVPELIAGFDFAHCKVGASIMIESNINVSALGYVHPDFIAAMAVQGTFYTPGHRWPLHSLARLGKVCNKLNLDPGESKDLGNQIVSDLLKDGLDKAAQKDPDYLQWLKDYNETSE